ncbi:MAG: hypothetical protein ACODAU_04055 [Myxococcota bacterium]
MEDPVEQAWKRVMERWDDPEAHGAFLALCMELDRMPEAGRRYREVRDTDPERSDEARRRIDELLAFAMHHLESSRTGPPAGRRGRRLFWVALGLSLFMVGAALWTMLGAH